MFPRLSVLQTTTVVYGTVWPQFATQVLTRCCDPPVWEEDEVVLGLGMAPGLLFKS